MSVPNGKAHCHSRLMACDICGVRRNRVNFALSDVCCGGWMRTITETVYVSGLESMNACHAESCMKARQPALQSV